MKGVNNNNMDLEFIFYFQLKNSHKPSHSYTDLLFYASAAKRKGG